MPFYDSHLHLFNSAHIPLYLTLQRAAKKASGLNGAGLGAVVSLLSIFGQLDNKLDRYESFLRFFDGRVDDNLSRIVGEIERAIGSEVSSVNDSLVLTPLILDLEMHDSCKRLGDQVRDVVEGIKVFHASRKASRDVRVLPFIGLDLRRFTSAQTIVQKFDDLMRDITGGKFTFDKSKTTSPLASGSCIGIKIYPLLDVDPADAKYRPLFVALAERGIPVAVHCQPNGYQLGDKASDVLEGYAHPARWREVLLDPKARNLKINFAHFGGDQQIKATVAWKPTGRDDGNTSVLGSGYGGLNRDTWTYQIIELLRCFPHTYADISAFDYTDLHAKAALRWLLALDEHDHDEWPVAPERLPPQDWAKHSLSEKLLWGSDYPMPLDKKDAPDYQRLWADFKKAIGVTKDRSMDDDHGPDLPPKPVTKPGELLQKMVSSNPERFLFG